MKIFEAVRIAAKARTPQRKGRFQASVQASPVELMIEEPHWRVRYEVAVSFEMTGPEAAIPDMRHTAVRAIAQEVFGEIKGDLLDLRNSLWEDDMYRGADDPALIQLENVIRKIGGGT